MFVLWIVQGHYTVRELCTGRELELEIPCGICQSTDLSSLVVYFLCSDYIIKEKTVLLQKKDNEGFGFVLRGAKGEMGTYCHTWRCKARSSQLGKSLNCLSTP